MRIVRRSVRRGGALVVAITAAASMAATAPTGAQTAPVAGAIVDQLTSAASGGSTDPSVSADGTTVVVTTNADLGGANPDGSYEVVAIQDGSPSPLTSTTGGFTGSAVISADGNVAAFVSDQDLTGDNPDGNREVFRHELGGSTTQVSDSAGGSGVGSATISGDGNLVAFVSTGDELADGTNADGNQELFAYSTTGGTTQVTDTASGVNADPEVSDDGSRIAFQSSADLTGLNADGNYELMIHTVGSTTTQVTNTSSGFTGSASISSDGSLVAFVSDADLVGTNADGNQEVFVVPTGGPIRQVTNSTSGFNGSVTVSGNGKVVAFVSDRSLGTNGAEGANLDGNEEVYHHSVSTRRTTPVTDTTGAVNAVPDTNRYGTRTALVSNADLVGGNADGSFEVFLARIPPPCNGRAVTVDLGAGDQPTEGRDVIRGTAGPDVIDSLGGNDIVCGLAGDDVIRLGSGNDRAFGDGGADRLVGKSGDDLLDGGTGPDVLRGSSGADVLRGGGGADQLDGGPGPDALDGGPGRDTCVGGLGADRASACEVRRSLP